MATDNNAAEGAHVDVEAAGPTDQTTAEGAPAPPPADPADALAVEVTELRRERDELYDRLLRKSADFENYRKRVERERRELTDSAAQDVLLELLPILDDFERAFAIEMPPGGEAYRDGVELIYKQLQDLLKKRGVMPIETIGEDFDPHIHQAVIHEESPTHREGEITGELRRGYRLGERLLRAPMVKVAKREQA